VKDHTTHKDNGNRIYNWPRAIFYIIFGLGLGALLGVWIWRSWAGGGGLFTDLSTCAEWTADVIVTIVLGYAVIVLVWIGLTAPVFWSEIGQKLVFRKLLGVQISNWSDVEAMKFSKSKSHDAANATSKKRAGKRRLEIALLEMEMELSIAIPPEHYDRIVRLAAEHGFRLDESEPSGSRTGEISTEPSKPSPSPEPARDPGESFQRVPGPLRDAARPSAGVTRLFDILTASPESAPETAKPAPETAKPAPKTAKPAPKSAKRRSGSSKNSKKRRR